MNNAILIGRLVKDPECRYTEKTGMAITRFTVAVDRPKKKGQEKAESDFIPCQAFQKTAELIANHFSKGSPILVVGSIRTGSYTNKQGQKVYTTEVMVNNIEFLPKPKATDTAPAQSSGGFESMGQTVPEDFDF